jgi:hypothetical protein
LIDNADSGEGLPSGRKIDSVWYQTDFTFALNFAQLACQSRFRATRFAA